MRRHNDKAVAFALRAACYGILGASLGMGVAGCDKMESSSRQADRVVASKLESSEMNRAMGADKSSAAFDDLQKAAGEAGASLASRIHAKSELAREEFDRAVAQLPVINQRTIQIEQALWELHQAGLQIQATQRTGAGYALAEPKETLAKVEADRAEVKKRLAKAVADAQAAQAQLTGRQQEIDALKQQRTQADAEADSLAEKSSAAKGEESLKLFTQSSEARVKAGTLAAQIETKTAALLPFQRALAIAQQQQQLCDNASKEAPGALQQLDEQQKRIEAGWQESQSQSAAMGDTAKQILAKSIAPAKNGAVANAGQRLKDLTTGSAEDGKGDKKNSSARGNDAQREQVAKLLSDSAKHFGEAAAAAKQLHSQMVSSNKKGTDAEVTLNTAMLSLFDENQYLLQQGMSENALADLYAGQFVEAQHRKQTFDELDKVLKASSLQLPAELGTADPAKPADEAAKAYKEAQKILGPVADSTTNSEDLSVIKNAALIGLLHADRGVYQVARSDEAKTAYNLDQAKAKAASIELPGSLRQPIE
jgi:hypothetical protein